MRLCVQIVDVILCRYYGVYIYILPGSILPRVDICIRRFFWESLAEHDDRGSGYLDSNLQKSSPLSNLTTILPYAGFAGPIYKLLVATKTTWVTCTSAPNIL